MHQHLEFSIYQLRINSEPWQKAILSLWNAEILRFIPYFLPLRLADLYWTRGSPDTWILSMAILLRLQVRLLWVAKRLATIFDIIIYFGWICWSMTAMTPHCTSLSRGECITEELQKISRAWIYLPLKRRGRGIVAPVIKSWNSRSLVRTSLHTFEINL